MILVALWTVQSVEAKGLNNFYADDEVEISEDIDATTFAAGQNVEISSEINGASFVAGENINLKSSQDLLFTAGQRINIENASTKDAFIAGEKINIKSSTIRDLFVAGQTITLDTDIERNAYIGGEKVTIKGNIGGDVLIAADEITIEDDVEILGTLKYPEDAKVKISKSASISKQKTYKNTEVNEPTIVEKLYDRVLAFLSMLVIAFLLLAINKKFFEKIEKIDQSFSEGSKQFGIGFVFLIVVPIAAIIAMCLVVGLGLGIVSLFLYGILCYLSAIPAAYYLGNIILKDKISNKYLLLGLSLLCIYAIRFVPILGGLSILITLCLGLGIYTTLIKNYLTTKKSK